MTTKLQLAAAHAIGLLTDIGVANLKRGEQPSALYTFTVADDLGEAVWGSVDQARAEMPGVLAKLGAECRRQGDTEAADRFDHLARGLLLAHPPKGPAS